MSKPFVPDRRTERLDLHDKKRAYRRNGVRAYVVWQIEEDRIDWFVLEDGNDLPLSPNGEGLLRSPPSPPIFRTPPSGPPA